ncbi:hypothetical protein [Motiliproteus sediminis]|uniref:hypothetical protein n=1 Tax=Motiliproteus sediminis TaxID=1468178 RepID=UPI001AEFE769|nr:hypothetical protein [Motiliproteus sediminis]
MTHYTQEYERLLFELQHLRWRAQNYGYSAAQLEQDIGRLQDHLANADPAQRASLSRLLDNFRSAVCAELAS